MCTLYRLSGNSGLGSSGTAVDKDEGDRRATSPTATQHKSYMLYERR